MENRIAGTNIICDSHVWFYTKIEDGFVHLYQPVTISYWTKDTLHPNWVQVKETKDKFQTYLGKLIITVPGYSIAISGVTLLPYTKAGYILYGK